MITIHATQKLYAKLPVDSAGRLPDRMMPTSQDVPADNPLSGWHANLLTLQRRNCVVLVHDSTRFPLFIKGLLKPDFARLDDLFADALMNTLLKLDATQNQLDVAAGLLSPCCYDTVCNRSVQGTMNQMAFGIEQMLAYDNARLEDVSAYRTAAWLAKTPCNVKGVKGCVWPDKAMLELLSGSGK
jgi:hypothetical protein